MESIEVKVKKKTEYNSATGAVEGVFTWNWTHIEDTVEHL